MLMRSSSTPLLVSLPTTSDAPIILKQASFYSGSDHFRRVSSNGSLQNLEAVSDRHANLPSMRKHGAPRPAKCHSVSPNGAYIGGGGMGGGDRRSGDDSLILKQVSSSSGSDHFRRVSSDGNLQNLEAVSDRHVNLPSMRKQGAPHLAKYSLVSPNVATIGGGGMGGGGRRSGDDAVGGDDQYELEMFYKKMVENNPCNALFLSNYAQYLWQVKHDAGSAEYYYSRAILAEPSDGQVLSKYGRLIWDIHHDHQRASTYFQQALQAAPEDSHVLASYANFLWETEDEASIPLGIVADRLYT